MFIAIFSNSAIAIHAIIGLRCYLTNNLAFMVTICFPTSGRRACASRIAEGWVPKHLNVGEYATCSFLLDLKTSMFPMGI